MKDDRIIVTTCASVPKRFTSLADSWTGRAPSTCCACIYLVTTRYRPSFDTLLHNFTWALCTERMHSVSSWPGNATTWLRALLKGPLLKYSIAVVKRWKLLRTVAERCSVWHPSFDVWHSTFVFSRCGHGCSPLVCIYSYIYEHAREHWIPDCFSKYFEWAWERS